jgi:7-cyano-7-deazaguanine synthase in queuosine biosynthesis
VLAIAKSEGRDCHALSIMYGQRHVVELEVMTGASLLLDTAHAVGDEMERRAQSWQDRIGVSRKAKQQQLDDLDRNDQ